MAIWTIILWLNGMPLLAYEKAYYSELDCQANLIEANSKFPASKLECVPLELK